MTLASKTARAVAAQSHLMINRGFQIRMSIQDASSAMMHCLASFDLSKIMPDFSIPGVLPR
jgi:hypothetical protein